MILRVSSKCLQVLAQVRNTVFGLPRREHSATERSRARGEIPGDIQEGKNSRKLYRCDQVGMHPNAAANYLERCGGSARLGRRQEEDDHDDWRGRTASVLPYT
jgi:hypothetical protein